MFFIEAFRNFSANNQIIFQSVFIKITVILSLVEYVATTDSMIWEILSLRAQFRCG